MSTNKKPKTGVMIAKIAAGLLFIYVGIAPDPEFDAGARGVSIIIGLAFVAWALVPYFSWKKRRQEVLEEIEKQEQEIKEMKAMLRNKPRKCPFCGANTKGSVCEYCGSLMTDTK